MASGESHDSRRGRSGCAARSFLVLCLYSSKATLKKDTKFEREVDVEGSVDMKARREVRDSRWTRNEWTIGKLQVGKGDASISSIAALE